jgi:hypothetical protein
MFDKHLSVDMLDYEKLFEDISDENEQEEMNSLSSIKEERESKEDQFLSKKESALRSAKQVTKNKDLQNTTPKE